MFANTSVKTVAKKQVEVPAEIVVSVAIPESELVCGLDGIVVSFKLEADMGGVTITKLGDFIKSCDLGICTFSQKYTVALGSNLSTSITVSWEIGGGKYSNKNCEEKESLVTVSAPANDFVTGGGYIILTDAVNGGSWVGDAGTKNNFGFNIKWSKNFSRLQGSFNTIWRTEDGRRFQARTNSAGALVVYKKLDANGKLIGYQANIIYTNVNIRELCDACTNGAGNGKVILTVYDWGEPGSNLAQKQPDEIGFVIFDNKGNIVHATNVYNNMDGLKPVGVQYLDAGNIQVHANPTNLENKSAEVLFTDDMEHALKVYPNPFTHRLYFDLQWNQTSHALLEIFDIRGVKLTTLFDNTVEAGHFYRIEYAPGAVTPGMLMYRLVIGNEVINGKVLYQKQK